jgi:hypothetical protein
VTSAAPVTAAEYGQRLTEKQWRGLVRETAEALRWRVLFELPDKAYLLLRDATRKNPAQGRLLPPKGWPDFIFGRDDGPTSRVLVVELKVGANRPSPEQVATLTTLAKADLEVYLWYPTDWEEITEILR